MAEAAIQNKSITAFKVVVLGSSGVGKTAIVQRLADDIFTYEITSTIGVEFKTFCTKVGDEDVKLNIWDTAGQERFRSVSKAYFRNAVGGLLVFSLNDRASFDALNGWLNDLQSLSSPNAVVILVGNKCDLKDERVIPETEAKAFADRHKLEYFESSALESINITETFVRLANKIVERVHKGEIKGNFTTSAKPPIEIEQRSKEQQNTGCSC